MNLEEAYLEHILLHLSSDDPDDRPLRTYLDSWYAHSIGPALYERKIPRPQWLNRGDLQKRPDLAFHCHAISFAAEQCIAKGDVSALAKDHSVPVNQVIRELKACEWSDRRTLREFLKRRYRVAVVTHDEHLRLGRGDAARKAEGVDFGSGDGAYARYDCPRYGIRYRVLMDCSSPLE